MVVDERRQRQSSTGWKSAVWLVLTKKSAVWSTSTKKGAIKMVILPLSVWDRVLICLLIKPKPDDPINKKLESERPNYLPVVQWSNLTP